MISEDEFSRVQCNIHGEPPPPVWVKLDCRCVSAADVALTRVREVMELVTKTRAVGWRADSWWEEMLPAWFLQTFKGHTQEEISENPMLWDFGSWLDAMKDPGWEWWSSSLVEDGWTINLTAINDPYSVEPLGYLVRAAGAEDVVFLEPGSCI